MDPIDWRAYFEQADRELHAALRRANGAERALAEAVRSREDYAMQTARIEDARLLAEQWLRSSDETTRRLGADLRQILADD